MSTANIARFWQLRNWPEKVAPVCNHFTLPNCTLPCICKICKMLEERVPWWLKSRHDNIFCWNFNVVLLFLSDKTSNLCNHLFPRKATQFRSRFCADLKLFGVPIPRVTHWLLSATRLSVTSFNVANASTLIGTLRHPPLRSWLQFQFRILSCVL